MHKFIHNYSQHRAHSYFCCSVRDVLPLAKNVAAAADAAFSVLEIISWGGRECDGYSDWVPGSENLFIALASSFGDILEEDTRV